MKSSHVASPRFRPQISQAHLHVERKPEIEEMPFQQKPDPDPFSTAKVVKASPLPEMGAFGISETLPGARLSYNYESEFCPI